MYDLIVIGAGAAGIFAAITAKKTSPSSRILVLEKGHPLEKVKLSGGGRCNFTHACFDPRDLVKNYPRGSKELLGPLHRFQPSDIISWFTDRGVLVKVEEDNRVFPSSNSSQTIVSCLLDQARKCDINIEYPAPVLAVERQPVGFSVNLAERTLHTNVLLMATGSSPDGLQIATNLGHTIVEPIPSLFAFQAPSSPFQELSGISSRVKLKFSGTPFSQEGMLLITHFGFSGPVVLKLSSWAARYLHETSYHADLSINWAPDRTSEEIFQDLITAKVKHPNKPVPPLLAPRLWKTLLSHYTFEGQRSLKTISHHELRKLSERLCDDSYHLAGKSTNKQEFVMCGGVKLREVNFATMESRMCPGLFFAGEMLDIDGLTGGFNLQSAWTTGYIAGSSCGTNLHTA